MQLRIITDQIKTYFPSLPYSPLLQTALHALGFDERQAQEFLHTQHDEFEQSEKIFGIVHAAEVIEEALKDSAKIVIHGDFDVDGVCATTILFDYLYYTRGADVLPIIPHRVDEGYGLSEATISKALAWGADMLITVDCGIKDVDLVKKYSDTLRFIITDHHQFYTNDQGAIELPAAKAVVHSAHPESQFPCMISGAATAWQLVRQLEILRKQNIEQNVDSNDEKTFLRNGAQTPDENTSVDVYDYLDLVAMSTVCDIIPLTMENRKFVQKGTAQTRKTSRVGLKELIKVSAIDPDKVDSFHFGFVLGPRLNAAARVTNDAMDALRLLSTRKKVQAESLAQKLNDLNIQRKALTQKYVDEAEKKLDLTKKALVVLGHEWPEGILGLIAGKLAEKHYKPVFVASADAEGKITGSSRSPLTSFYLNKALEHAKQHLNRFGGHKQAAGFASEITKFEGFEQAVLEFIEKNTTDEDFQKSLEIVAKLDDITSVKIADVEELTLLEPHGLGNQKPLFLFEHVLVQDFKKLGSDQSHLKLLVQCNGTPLEAIGFSMAQEFYPLLHIGQSISIVGHLGVNEWNGNKKLQVEIKTILM